MRSFWPVWVLTVMTVSYTATSPNVKRLERLIGHRCANGSHLTYEMGIQIWTQQMLIKSRIALPYASPPRIPSELA